MVAFGQVRRGRHGGASWGTVGSGLFWQGRRGDAS